MEPMIGFTLGQVVQLASAQYDGACQSYTVLSRIGPLADAPTRYELAMQTKDGLLTFTLPEHALVSAEFAQ